MEEVTGRDNQIICQALQIAIPIMLKHSMSASNTFDMLRILDSRGNRSSLKLLDTSVREFLEKIIDDIENGNTLAKEKKSKTMDMETELYFSKDDVMTFLEKRYKSKSGKIYKFPQKTDEWFGGLLFDKQDYLSI